MFVNVSPEIRDGLVKQMIDAGCSISIAHETIDLAAHAIDQAIETVRVTCKRASSPFTMMSAQILALQMLETVAKIHAEAAAVAADKIGASMGIKAVVISGEGEG